MTTTTQAHVDDGNILRTVTVTDVEDLPDPTTGPDEVDRPDAVWLPVERVVPDHDPATHRPTGATLTVEADRVLATHAIVEIVTDDEDDPSGE